MKLNDVVTVKELAKLLKVHEATIYRQIALGKLNWFVLRIGRSIRIDLSKPAKTSHKKEVKKHGIRKTEY
jgi:excisionase family DNA binding protein